MPRFDTADSIDDPVEAVFLDRFAGGEGCSERRGALGLSRVHLNDGRAGARG